MKKIGLINFTIVALIGVLMRYKIGFEFPYFDQKHLQHGHSHFAFAGWVTHILYVLLADFLKSQNPSKFSKKIYNTLIISNLICAYGMLISFTIQGYAFYSISFATASIFVSYAFTIFYIQDLKSIQHISTKWFKAALIFNSLSSLGTFYLAYMMATKSIGMNSYLASIYFYLHFQYSGWFFFGCMGIFLSYLTSFPNFKYNPLIFKLFSFACIPGYLLSILWLNFSFWVYIPVILVVSSQLLGLFLFFKILKPFWNEIHEKWGHLVKFMLFCVLIALFLKLTLQAVSIHPDIAKMAFGFRPIVIAYLHLVLLVFTSLFLIVFLILNQTLPLNNIAIISIVFLVISVFLNEFVLMIQGIASMGYIVIPYLNYVLFGITIWILISLIGILLSLTKMNKNKLLL